jgi:hypothetical protein
MKSYLKVSPQHSEALISRLRNKSSDERTLMRTVWRIGELAIVDAVPDLIALAQTELSARSLYTIAWALGRCQDSSALNVLKNLTDHADAYVRTIAFEAQYQCSSLKDKAALIKECEAYLPKKVTKDSLDQNNISKLYLLSIENKKLRQSLYNLLKTIPFEYNSFWIIRSFFKLSEFRRDAEFYALLINRIQLTPAKSDFDHRYYSPNTRDYFRRRAWRMLKNMGNVGDPIYVDMAAAILKLVNDKDSKTKITRHYYWHGFNNHGTITRHYDAFANYPVFHQILFRNSKRYSSKTGICWQVKNDQPESNRTEAYSELWNQKPELVFGLLQESSCELVHEFACKVLKENEKFCLTLSLSAWKPILLNSYAISANFALKFVEKHHANVDDLNFIFACLNASIFEVRQAAKNWLLKNVPINKLLEDLRWLSKLTLSSYDEIRLFARVYYPAINQHSEQQAAFLVQLIARIHSLNVETTAFANIINDVRWVLFNPMKNLLPNISLSVIEDLIKHPAIEVQALGIELLGTINESELVIMSKTLVEFLLSDNNLIRQQGRKIIQRLAKKNDMFAKAVLLRLIPFIFWKEKSEGLHEILIACISNDLKNTWSSIDDKLLWRLLMAKSKAAQAIGAEIIVSRSGKIYSVRQWAQLAKHSALAVRQWSWRNYENNIKTIRNSFEDSLRILDTDWNDTRNFAIEFYRNKFKARDWNINSVILLCDSVREDVQVLGQELITKFFKTKHGTEYLLKLSQHPAKNVQLFASGFLQHYAQGNIENILQLKAYFVSVLSSVNKGRVAKDRVLNFLITEAQKDKQVARFFAEILEDNAITVAIMDKEKFILAMCDLHAQYPDIKLPIYYQKPRLHYAR